MIRKYDNLEQDSINKDNRERYKVKNNKWKNRHTDMKVYVIIFLKRR